MVCGAECQVNQRGRAGNSDATKETARVQGAGGIKLALDGFHEGQGVAWRAPGVESRERCGAMEKDEGTPYFVEVRAQCGECGMQVVGGALEAKPAETGCVHH